MSEAESSGALDETEEIEWFLGVRPLKIMRSGSLHGLCWQLEDTSEASLADLEAKLVKLNAGIEAVERQQTELQQKLILLQEQEESEDDSNWVSDSESEESDDMPDNIEDIEDAIDNLDVAKLKITAKRDELQSEKDALLSVKMTVMRGPAYQVAQHVDRLDAPWLMFVKRKEATKAVFVAKLLTAGAAYSPTGKLLKGSDQACKDPQSLEPFVHEIERIHEALWEAVGLFGEGNFNNVGLLPPVGAFAVSSYHRVFGRRHSLAVVSLLAQNGPINEVLRKMGNIKDVTWFSDSFLLSNLERLIFSMAILEDRGVNHGNIKPSNLLVSDDGFQLLLSDFLPPSEVQRTLTEAALGVINMPPNMSPELRRLLKTGRSDWEAVRNRINFFKNDVWCLGATFFALATRAEPSAVARSQSILHDALVELEGRLPALVSILNRMLTWNQAARPTFNQLLSPDQKKAIVAKSVQRGVLEAFGFKGLADIQEERLPGATEKKPPATESAASSDGKCCVC